MLYEILCEQFKCNDKPRGIIRFNETLNVVKGHDSGTNSIGKSTFLLAIDFAFGGNSYAEDKSLIKKIGHHTINYCFKFGDEFYYFSRNTATPKEVNICNAEYVLQETIPIDEYNNKLLKLYSIDLPNISFRQIVGRYFRVYGRGSSNERKPLASYDGEAPKESLIALLKLFNGYTPIETLYLELKDKDERKKAIINADKYNLVTIIKSKKDYQKNLSDIERLNGELQSLARFGRQELLYLDPAQAEKAAEYKSRYETLTRRKKQLWAKYYSIKNNAERTHASTAQDFNALLQFFPNSDIKLLSDIENFHSKITDILSEEFTISMSQILKQINEISIELTQIEVSLKELDVPKRIADSTLKAYAQAQNQINELNRQNELYVTKREIETDIRTLKAKYQQLFTDIFKDITSKINDVMAKLNAFIYGENIVAPVLIVTKPNSYTFGTDMDDGTGTNYKNLILLDLASLKLTELPTIAHDTIVFHNIGQEPMAKILELYNKSEKQIFIAIDESAKYNEIAQKIIENNKILELSGNGNELFGSSWITKTSDSDLQE
ncbi:MAG: hypothetical protein DBX61_00330 [Clostridiales bacterium]|jgi:ATPase|nr:MAG: hypothetical protein DBX61_00330 [Clostridiales bacterium]